MRDLRAADGGAQLLLMLEGAQGARERLVIFSTRLPRIPQIGALDDGELAALRHEAEVSAAIAAGLRTLSACGASEKHLTEKLRARGHRADVAREAVLDLAARGYLNECEGAVREVERGLAKLWGDRRILMDLHAKGYGEAAMEQARERLCDEDAVTRCAHCLRRLHIACPSDQAQLQRLLARMVRYGYEAHEVKCALTQLFRKN